VETFFSSDLFASLDERRQAIRDYANARYSWDAVGERTESVYAAVLAARRNSDAAVQAAGNATPPRVGPQTTD
jgi:hypothetical protein